MDCKICGYKAFKTNKQFHNHMKNSHNVTDETGVPRLDFASLFATSRKYEPMDPVTKQGIVTRFEKTLRDAAWYGGRLNPLIGCDKISGEPIWAIEKETLE